MPIKVYSDRIELGDRVITATPTGIRIDASLSANTQNTAMPFVNTSNFTARELAYGNLGFQGTVAGFTTAGYSPALPNFGTNTTNKFPFATNSNATNGSTLTQEIWAVAGCSSAVHSYRAGGNIAPFTPNFTNTIDKFPFAGGANATDVGDLTNAQRNVQGCSSAYNGYIVSAIKTPPGVRDGIEKFPFATDTNATSIGFLTTGMYQRATQSSKTHGYASGGPPGSNIINKFPFAADTNAIDIGDLTQGRAGGAGQSSTTHGYTSGGFGPPSVNTIDKFPFSTDTNATDVGDLTVIRQDAAGQSSTVSGYTSGGIGISDTYYNTIDKFPFAADTNASDVGDLATTVASPAGTQF